VLASVPTRSAAVHEVRTLVQMECVGLGMTAEIIVAVNRG
jgi:hypothetical protein